MTQAHTSTNYSGLYASVESFGKPDPATLAAVSDHFPGAREISNMAEAMVAIDERMEHLQAVKKAATKNHPLILTSFRCKRLSSCTNFSRTFCAHPIFEENLPGSFMN